MLYTKEQRLDIGRQIYDGEMTRYEAAEKYGISDQTARDYMRLYRNTNNLPPKQAGRSSGTAHVTVNMAVNTKQTDISDLEAMTKEELIKELVKARIREARLKKGYEVKGDGAVILYGSKNTK